GVNRQPDPFAERVAGKKLEREALLLGALDRLLAGAERRHFATEFGEPRNFRLERAHERMIGRERAEARAEDRVVARRIDGELLVERVAIVVLEREGEAHAFRAADPIGLHEADLLGPAREP